MKSSPLLADMQLMRNAQGTNFKVTDSEWKALLSLTADQTQDSLAELSRSTHIPKVEWSGIENLLRSKKQIIFEGPPGSGKTYVARLFARYMAGVGLGDEETDRVEIVQFHQSYGYEDFVAGIRPVTSASGQLTYRSQPGIFLEMCERAAARPDETFVLIIDEINRGNLSRIFGELLYGLEYRDQTVRLQTPVEMDDKVVEQLRIPSNLYLIGTMNSTDRSLAMIDYALRRRFYFWRLMPTESGQAPVLRRWLDAQSEVSPLGRARLHDAFVELNERISGNLGEDYQIGHSYFMLGNGEIEDPAAHARVWRHAIEPLLREYFHTRSDAGATIEQLRVSFFKEPVAVDEIDVIVDDEA
jgi:5-methylcytosine-specific restriction protein B